MDAIEMLEQDHREIESLFESFEAGGDRRAAFEKLADLLAVHMEIEEQVFYPATKDSRNAGELQEAVQEHLQIKRLVADLLALDVESAAFEAKMKVLEEQIEHHVEEEEEELFAVVRDELDEDQLASLADEMETLAEELEEAGEPRKAVPSQIEEAAPIH